MKLFEGYTRLALAVAFGTSLLYVFVFMIFKANKLDGLLISINVIYAIFVLVTVVWDRMGWFETSRNAKLVTLGTAVAPIATNIADVLFSILFAYPNDRWPHAVYFLGVAFVFLIFLLVLCFAIPVESQELKKRPRSSSGS